MTAISARPSDYLIAISAAFVLHGAFLLVFVATMIIVINSESLRKSRRTPPPVVTVEIRPEYFSRLEKPAEAEPVPERKQYQRTTPAQESEERPDGARLTGERNTLAATDRAPDPDGPALPSQEGENPRHPGERQTFDSRFQEGEEPDVATTVPREERLPGANELPKPAEEEIKGLAGEDREDRLGTAKTELLKTENQLPVPERDGEGDVPDKEMRPRESTATNPAEAANLPGGAAEQAQKPVEEQLKQPGFRSEVRKTRLQGSIRRRGTTALDVENSPLGRYQASLSRAVENEWQKNCVRYRDHISPGLLTIRFLVDERGNVSGVRFLDSVEAGEIQKGFTLKSIQNAAIPAMPKSVKDSLNGDPLELVYNFFF